MRKPNSLFDQVCKFINSLPIGSIFETNDLYSNTNEEATHYKQEYSDIHQTVRYYRWFLIQAGCVEKLGKCKWKVTAHIPDEVTLTMVKPTWEKNLNKTWKSN